VAKTLVEEGQTMNEHIEKIALDAGMVKTSLHYGRKDPYVLWENDIETFAEKLIEKICYDLMNVHGASPEHIEHVAKHYGVNL
jgi:hypothetical protein